MDDSPEEMEPIIEAYFAECDAADVPYTIPGLALALGFSSRETFLDYENRSGFTYMVKRAKLRIEGQLARELVTRPGDVADIISDLKNNFGWKDSQEHTHTGPDGGAIIMWGTGLTEGGEA